MVGRIIKQRKEKPIGRHKRGYMRVGIWQDGKSYRGVGVHQMVCEAFHGRAPSPKHEPNHRDGRKTNNHASNLEWCTRSENMKHAYATGARQPANTISAATAREIRTMLSQGCTYREIASIIGCSFTTIRHIKYAD